MDATKVKITDDWFLPHFDARFDRPLELAVVTFWKEYMGYENEYACGWTTRLIALLTSIPQGLTIRTAKVAATFAVWSMMPVGLSFLESALRKAKEKSHGWNDYSSERDSAIASWAIENQLGLLTVNRLQHLLMTNGNPVYKNAPYATLADNRAVEETLCFFVTRDGRMFLQEVCKRSGMPDRLPLK